MVVLRVATACLIVVFEAAAQLVVAVVEMELGLALGSTADVRAGLRSRHLTSTLNDKKSPIAFRSHLRE